jgi:cell division protein FtsL
MSNLLQDKHYEDAPSLLQDKHKTTKQLFCFLAFSLVVVVLLLVSHKHQTLVLFSSMKLLWKEKKNPKNLSSLLPSHPY